MTEVYGECDYASHTLRIASHVSNDKVGEVRMASDVRTTAATVVLGANEVACLGVDETAITNQIIR